MLINVEVDYDKDINIKEFAIPDGVVALANESLAHLPMEVETLYIPKSRKNRRRNTFWRGNCLRCFIKKKGDKQKMEVYVLYGRVYYSEAVFDTEGNYFGESPVIEVFTNFDSALKTLKEYALEAYNHLRECGSWIVDDSFMENTTEEDLFTNYNLGEEEDPIELNVCWEYKEKEDSVYWQMTAKNIPWDVQIPILAGLHIRKVLVND